MNHSLLLIAAFLISALLTSAPALSAESDTVTRLNGEKGMSGEIKLVSRTEVVVHQPIGNREEHIPANEIADVEWRREPAPLGLGRGYEKSGNYPQSLASYTEALAAIPVTQRDMRADVEFRIARVMSKMNQSSQAESTAALERLKGWTEANRDHFRFYAAQQLLGDAALRARDFLLADNAFDRLLQAPWPATQFSGKIGMARSALAQEKLTIAKSLFDELAATPADSPALKAVRLEALLGQAQCLRRSDQSAQAAEKLQTVIDETGPQEDRLLADAYVQLGNCLAGDPQRLKDATLAYLHVEVVPTLAAHADLHAESLYQLAKLWPAIGQPVRGVEAAEKLKQRYPDSPWTKKLQSGG